MPGSPEGPRQHRRPDSVSVVMVSLVCLVESGLWSREGASSGSRHKPESASSRRALQVDLEAEIRARAGGGLRRSPWGCQSSETWSSPWQCVLCTLGTRQPSSGLGVALAGCGGQSSALLGDRVSCSPGLPSQAGRRAAPLRCPWCRREQPWRGPGGAGVLLTAPA